jgi:hypothetical protein
MLHLQVAHDHVLSGSFPLDAFDHIILYTSAPHLRNMLTQTLSRAQCPQHELLVELPPPPSTTALQGQQAVELMEGVGPAAAPAAPSGELAAAPSDRSTRLDAPALAPATLRPPGSSSTSSLDWPLVVSSNAQRGLRSRREVYDSLLQLEREGAVLVERPLALLDLVLAPSTALAIHDNTDINLVRQGRRAD